MNPTTYRDRIEQKLKASLAPIHLEIIDDSARHRGHAGHDPKGETHFKIAITSAAFNGRTLVERHRMVYATLADELKERVHALNISACGDKE